MSKIKLFTVSVKKSLMSSDVGNKYLVGIVIIILFTHIPSKIQRSYIGFDLFDPEVDRATHSMKYP